MATGFPAKLVYMPSMLGLIFLSSAFVFWPSGILAALFLLIGAYFAYAQLKFSSTGGNVQNQIWDQVISNLDWNGEGKALDIGCGNGALTIKLAQKFNTAKVAGIDYWGAKWEYSKNTCESNAEIEGVNERATFQKANALKLPFEDGFFDAAVSNLVFHEVADAKDKREVIKEALRVVKKGGKFAFQDLFLEKHLYGDTDELVTTIKSWGITKVEFIETRNASFIPIALKLPFMVGKIGIIKGEK
jgi:ubiquinone/menaquinone biosynthesis C-methylase UbiE